MSDTPAGGRKPLSVEEQLADALMWQAFYAGQLEQYETALINVQARCPHETCTIAGSTAETSGWHRICSLCGLVTKADGSPTDAEEVSLTGLPYTSRQVAKRVEQMEFARRTHDALEAGEFEAIGVEELRARLSGGSVAEAGDESGDSAEEVAGDSDEIAGKTDGNWRDLSVCSCVLAVRGRRKTDKACPVHGRAARLQGRG